MTMPDLRNIAIWLLLALAVAGWGVGCAERTRAGLVTNQRDEARAERDAARGERNSLSAAVTAQKAEAAATLRTLQASVLAQQKRIDEAHAAQEKTDATNLSTLAELRDRLRRERLQRASEDARRGSGGGGAPGAPGAGADHRAAGGAQAAGLLPAAPDREADEEADAYDADQINAAYASCRADAFGARGLTR
ncbi:hypothetical protein [Variovorax sp. DXTD-1]|uniref:hypothetical protein n=1 Tax=Variovorax sp. DXTD-1 TaxID=2495592 RepID=UPI000F898E06|nr:hypothetical protein [Variovorax sp. DXTD-1]RST54094.1 hypothetical protein EJI00_02915 [Variovorax sp. DXTD-1]